MQSEHDRAWQHVRDTFQTVWGYAEFRPPQGEIVRCLLEGRDALIVMPTGGGKSICFQLPALLQQGVTLVVSPLVALMENQVQDLRQRQLPAAVLHSELPTQQRRQTLAALEQQRLRLLYLSPETLLTEAVWQRLCRPELRVNGLILDEAHCLVQWGETFRPAYRRLGTVRPALLQHKPPGSQMAIAAFTATADPQAQATIQEVLGLHQPATFLLNPYRPNLALSVQPVSTPRARRQRLLHFVQDHRGQSGLIYVRTRRDSEDLAAWLQQQQFQTAAYHAGLSPHQRRAIEADWLKGTLPFVICTSAFGMGINKPDCRWVAHVHAPVLLSEYVQEVGRAGRDGQPAQAMTLVSNWLDPEDRQRWQFFEKRARQQQQEAQRLVSQLPPQGHVNGVSRQFNNGAIALALLHSQGQIQWHDPFHYSIQAGARPQRHSSTPHTAMQQYLKTRDCRWKFLLNAFGFTDASRTMHCGTCDRCRTR